MLGKTQPVKWHIKMFVCSITTMLPAGTNTTNLLVHGPHILQTNRNYHVNYNKRHFMRYMRTYIYKEYMKMMGKKKHHFQAITTFPSIGQTHQCTISKVKKKQKKRQLWGGYEYRQMKIHIIICIYIYVYIRYKFVRRHQHY